MNLPKDLTLIGEQISSAHEALHEFERLLSMDEAIREAPWPEGGPGELTDRARAALNRVHEAIHRAAEHA